MISIHEYNCSSEEGIVFEVPGDSTALGTEG